MRRMPKEKFAEIDFRPESCDPLFTTPGVYRVSQVGFKDTITMGILVTITRSEGNTTKAKTSKSFEPVCFDRIP